ncbi:hypothetical protein PLICRDRAFT_29833 [Plicaturopsis crispa FD-325 SS-3]|nr:hypothetical protein PLICRDRAFT_29833 [Plicaturopsis crispa FD-325 SS-3]
MFWEIVVAILFFLVVFGAFATIFMIKLRARRRRGALHAQSIHPESGMVHVRSPYNVIRRPEQAYTHEKPIMSPASSHLSPHRHEKSSHIAIKKPGDSNEGRATVQRAQRSARSLRNPYSSGRASIRRGDNLESFSGSLGSTVANMSSARLPTGKAACTVALSCMSETCVRPDEGINSVALWLKLESSCQNIDIHYQYHAMRTLG